MREPPESKGGPRVECSAMGVDSIILICTSVLSMIIYIVSYNVVYHR